MWEGAKVVMRGKMIQIASHHKKMRLKELISLENRIKQLEIDPKTTATHSTLLELKETRAALDKLLTYKAEGALRFSKQRYYEMGNRASRLLSFQLRKAQVDRHVPKVYHPKFKEIVSHPQKIAEAFATFYKNLYENPKQQTDDVKIEAFLTGLDLPSLTDAEALEIVSDITEKEVREAIKNLKTINPLGQMDYLENFINVS